VNKSKLYKLQRIGKRLKNNRSILIVNSLIKRKMSTNFDDLIFLKIKDAILYYYRYFNKILFFKEYINLS